MTVTTQETAHIFVVLNPMAGSCTDDDVRQALNRHLGDLISLASTFNEPNLPMLLRWVSNIDIPFTTVMRMSRQASRAVGGGQFGCFFLGDPEKLEKHMIAAHHRVFEALKSGPGAYPVGLNIALQDEQAVGTGRPRGGEGQCAGDGAPQAGAAVAPAVVPASRMVRRDAWISGESSAGPIVPSTSASATSRRTSFSRCRTLPGHVYSSKTGWYAYLD